MHIEHRAGGRLCRRIRRRQVGESWNRRGQGAGGGTFVAILGASKLTYVDAAPPNTVPTGLAPTSGRCAPAAPARRQSSPAPVPIGLEGDSVLKLNASAPTGIRHHRVRVGDASAWRFQGPHHGLAAPTSMGAISRHSDPPRPSGAAIGRSAGRPPSDSVAQRLSKDLPNPRGTLPGHRQIGRTPAAAVFFCVVGPAASQAATPAPPAHETGATPATWFAPEHHLASFHRSEFLSHVFYLASLPRGYLSNKP